MCLFDSGQDSGCRTQQSASELASISVQKCREQEIGFEHHVVVIIKRSIQKSRKWTGHLWISGR